MHNLAFIAATILNFVQALPAWPSKLKIQNCGGNECLITHITPIGREFSPNTDSSKGYCCQTFSLPNFFFYWLGRWRRATVQNFTKRIKSSLSVLCSPQIMLTRSPQISGQNKSGGQGPEGMVKITYGVWRMEVFGLAGNSN